mmetsp:Transcript_17548/g.52808  ORF Transcript_17548/g.52808 Transcript_17548/m.52808 type:complete len:210 (-) Transcript_17548:278-907(-)
MVLAEVIEFTSALHRDSAEDMLLPTKVDSQSSSPWMVLVDWCSARFRCWEPFRMSSVAALSFVPVDFRCLLGDDSVTASSAIAPGEVERWRAALSSRTFSTATFVGLPRPRPMVLLWPRSWTSQRVWFLSAGHGGADSPRVVGGCTPRANCRFPPARVMSASRPAIGRPWRASILLRLGEAAPNSSLDSAAKCRLPPHSERSAPCPDSG